jgi:hypothetical protein
MDINASSVTRRFHAICGGTYKPKHVFRISKLSRPIRSPSFDLTVLLFVLSKSKSQIAAMVSPSPRTLHVFWGCRLLTMMYGGWTEIRIASTPGIERQNYTPLTFKFRMLPTELLYTWTCFPIH